MASEKAKLKKAYIKGLIAAGDKRSYNEIQADLELMLWKERWESIFSAEPVIAPENPAALEAEVVEEPK